MASTNSSNSTDISSFRKMTLGAFLSSFELDQPRRTNDIFLEINSRVASPNLLMVCFSSGKSLPMIQRTSESVGAGTFGRVGSKAARAGSGLGRAFGMLVDEPALPRGRAAMTGGRTVTYFGMSIGPKMLMTSSSLPSLARTATSTAISASSQSLVTTQPTANASRGC